jgi:predicted PurR-regulated permease PerM
MLGAKGAEVTVQALQKTISGVAWLINVGMLVVMTPMVAFYLLMDWRSVMDKALNLLPRKWRKETVNIAGEIDTKLAAYLRGTLAVCASLAAFYAMALTNIGWIASAMSGHKLDGLEMGWAIGLMTGFLGFFPVIGATVGVCTMLAVALVQYQLLVWEPYALIGIVFVVGQFLEGYVLTPLLVGNRVGLHPLWVLFALLAGGALNGITGMLMAIPLAVVLSVILPRILNEWRNAVR